MVIVSIFGVVDNSLRRYDFLFDFILRWWLFQILFVILHVQFTVFDKLLVISMTNVTLLLVALLVCHYLADFCLTMPMMIRAKADGKNPWPIALHAAIHAVLMGVCLLIYGVGWQLLMVLIMIELISHFVLDISKAKISDKCPYWSNNQHKPYWILYGLDQLLHQMVVILIWQLAIT